MLLVSFLSISCALTSLLAFTAVPDDPTQFILNPDAIGSAAFKAAWYPHFPNGTSPEDQRANPAYHVRVVDATFHMQKALPGRELEQKMFCGVVLSYTTPTSTGQVFGNVAVSRNAAIAGLAPNKRIRTGVHALSSHSKCMMLADCTGMSVQVAAVMFSGTRTLYRSCGQTTIGNDITIGDVIGIYEPGLTDRTLGKSIPIFDTWRCIVPLKTNILVPRKQIQMSSQANQQIHFCQHQCQVQISKATLVSASEVPCVGVTCDRQNRTCKGCNGHATIRRNVVLECVVDVLNQPLYNETTSRATFDFRSFAFTTLVINLASIANLDYDQMHIHHNGIRSAVRAIEAHVNGNGGWTVIGWHRRGVLVNDEGSYDVNSLTKGHLVRLEPTNITDASIAAIRALRFSCET